MKKTYGIYGKVEQLIVLHAGRASMTLHFEGGAITPYGTSPAEFTTSNPMWQAVIERSPEFTGGLIKLVRQYGEPAKEPAKEEKKAEGVLPIEAEGDDLPEGYVRVSGREDAVEYMRSHYGIPTRDMRSVATVKKAAAAHGITFVGI